MSATNRPFIFVSCGQYTDAEKRLGKHIAKVTKDLTGFEAFFAENVQDLNGLDSNILNALRDAVALIVVLHPRGTVGCPDGSSLTRASVWIEQEIAIATYIQRVENRSLPVIVFKHASVGREGLRDLLHLNPIEFTDESEVLAALPEQLSAWRNSLTRSGIRLELASIPSRSQDGHPIRELQLKLINDSNQRITRYNGELLIPAGLLKHWSAVYAHEVGRSNPRCFRFDEENTKGAISPHDQVPMLTLDYCTTCAVEDAGRIAALVSESKIEAKMWIEDREYSVEKTLIQMARDAEKHT